MNSVKILCLLCALLVMGACENEGKYPITGEDCGPEDPVQSLDAADCVATPTGAVL
jgi:hypothetical protein